MEPNETKVWFYIKDRQQKGPIGIFELTKLLDQGVLNGETFLWTAGFENWQMAKTIGQFQGYGTAASPPDYTTIGFLKSKPLVRILAKLFDLSLLTVLLSTFISIFSPVLKTSKFTLFIIYLILWILFEPIMLTIFGTTIGKSLLNLKVKNVNGELLDYITALKRNLFIFAPGKGLGYPLIMLTLNSLPLFALGEKTRTLWDEKAETIVLYGNVSIPRFLLGFCFPLAVFIFGIFISG